MSARDDASRDGGQASASRRVRLALLDDHELLLDSVANWIESNEDDFELGGGRLQDRLQSGEQGGKRVLAVINRNYHRDARW